MSYIQTFVESLNKFLQVLSPLDIAIFVAFFAVQILIGFLSMRKAGESASEFFLSGRSQPWWLLGFSMVATTFAADTPNLVTQIVREQGVAGNWQWWAFLLTGATTVFIYAKLWRRLGVMTDIEFYEVRYSGKPAAFLRGFRTLYLGLICNIFVMANVSLAIIKILGVILGVDPVTTLVIAGSVTMIFCALGGFTAVLWVDCVLFLVAMAGAIVVAVFALGDPAVGGLTGLFSNEVVRTKMAVLPDFSNWELVLTVLLVPLAVQWWSVWYPGAEPGGGSTGTQHLLSAKSEGHAVGATFFFNFCHYAIRPWPWILAALASIVIFPNIESIQAALAANNVNLPDSMVKDDLAYPLMIAKLPHGWLGLVLVSLFAAYMSTIASWLALGSNYMVNDFYKRFINPQASERRLVFWGRVWTVIILLMSSCLALLLTSAKDNFDIILSIGAGTGLLFLLRWFWWRINAWSEIAAMVAALPTAIYFRLIHMNLMNNIYGEGKVPEWLNLNSSEQLLVSVAFVTVFWILVTLVTKPTSDQKLREFVIRSAAGGPGWKRVTDKAKAEGVVLPGANEKWPVPMGILCSILTCFAIYGALFASGYWLYGDIIKGSVLTVVTVVSSILLYFGWRQLNAIEKKIEVEIQADQAKLAQRQPNEPAA